MTKNDKRDAAIQKLKEFEIMLLSETKRTLNHLNYGSKQAKENPFPWKGADVVITYPNIKYENTSKVVCRSEHAYVLASALKKIKVCVSGAINYFDKIMFYGEIVECAKVELKQGSNIKYVLLSMCKRGQQILMDYGS